EFVAENLAAPATPPFLRHENENTTPTVSNAQTRSQHTHKTQPRAHNVNPRNPPRAPAPLHPPHPARRRLPLDQAVSAGRAHRHRGQIHAPPGHVDGETCGDGPGGDGHLGHGCEARDAGVRGACAGEGVGGSGVGGGGG
ncbi:hypothetical protein V492_08128, partial [Pseudogymnoascus sp. VKM F-4246]